MKNQYLICKVSELLRRLESEPTIFIDQTPLRLSNILAQLGIVLDNQAGQLLSHGNVTLMKLENFY